MPWRSLRFGRTAVDRPGTGIADYPRATAVGPELSGSIGRAVGQLHRTHPPGYRPGVRVFLFRQALAGLYRSTLWRPPAWMGVANSLFLYHHLAARASRARRVSAHHIHGCLNNFIQPQIILQTRRSFSVPHRPVKRALRCRLWLAHGWHGGVYCSGHGSLFALAKGFHRWAHLRSRQRLGERTTYDRAAQ